jgi:hypothetical protein
VSATGLTVPVSLLRVYIGCAGESGGSCPGYSTTGPDGASYNSGSNAGGSVASSGGAAPGGNGSVIIVTQ